MESTPATLNTIEKAEKIPLLAEKVYLFVHEKIHLAKTLVSMEARGPSPFDLRRGWQRRRLPSSN